MKLFGRKKQAKTIDWLVKGSGKRENSIEVQTAITIELSVLKRQCLHTFNEVLRQHTKRRLKQEKTMAVARKVSKNARRGVTTDVLTCKCGGVLTMRTKVEKGKIRHFCSCDSCHRTARKPKDLM